MENLLSNFNYWTIAGIFCAFLTYFFIQKGTIVNAQKNKEEIKTEIDIVQTKAINAINETTKLTIEKMKSSSDALLNDIQLKSQNLSSSLSNLKELTDKQTELTIAKIKSSSDSLLNDIQIKSQNLSSSLSNLKELTDRQSESVKSNTNLNKQILYSSPNYLRYIFPKGYALYDENGSILISYLPDSPAIQRCIVSWDNLLITHTETKFGIEFKELILQEKTSEGFKNVGNMQGVKITQTFPDGLKQLEGKEISLKIPGMIMGLQIFMKCLEIEHSKMTLYAIGFK